MRKNLIIKQHDFTDCGPACLLSVIIYYGGFVPIYILRNNCFTDKDGTSAYNLINCAKKYGLSASGIKVDNIDKITKDKLPCIAHVNLKHGFNHFVVIYKIEKNSIVIMDPAHGKRKINKDDFNKMFSSVIILLHPYTKLEKLDKPKSVKKIIINLILNNKLNMSLLILISLLMIIISLIINYFLKIGNTIINQGYSLNILYNLVIIYLVLYLVKNLFEYLKNNLIINFNKKITVSLYEDFSQNIFNLPLNFIKSRTSGEIISRYNELSEISVLLPGIILSIFLDLIMVIITLCFSLTISFKLTLIVIIFMIVYFLVSYIFKNPTLNKINRNLDENASLNSIIIESINNLRSIKNLNNEDNMRNKVNKRCEKTISDNKNLDKYYNKVNFIKNLLYDLMICFVSSYGLYLIIRNKMNIVDLFTFLMVISYFTEPIKDLIDMITKYCFIKVSIDKLSELYISSSKNLTKKQFENGDIQICNLSYAYNGIDFIIKNFSCFIKNKSKVLLKGNSGSGKSTLCQLISKQLNNYNGKIFINHNNLIDINDDSFRKNVTYIGQKDTLIVDTIENNIKYERKVDNQEFKTICKICEIDKIVSNKFSRYGNYICESSDNISGGERQRITLARGLINCGKILILDESLSEVNKKMEERIIKSIFKYYYDRTIIYVSHKNYNNIFDQTLRI